VAEIRSVAIIGAGALGLLYAQALNGNSDLGLNLLAKDENYEHIKKGDITNWYTILNQLGKNGKTSMLQDIENKRKTEAGAFAGRLIKLADKYGIDVPLNKTLYRFIKVKELQNAN